MLAAFDQVPSELHDNSLILGGLSFLVGFIMLFDLSDPMARLVADTTQTDDNLTIQSTETHNQATLSTNNIHKNNNNDRTDVGQKTNIENTTSELPTQRMTITSLATGPPYHRDSVDFVQMEQMPHAQQPIFEQVLIPEKKRSIVTKVPDPGTNAAHREIIHRQPPMHSTSYYDEYRPSEVAPRYPMHAINMRQPSRFRDIEDGGPMMVIRDYSRVIPQSNGGCGSTAHHYNVMNSSNENNKRRTQTHQQPDPIRPGFVANAAKMWNRRAQQSMDHRGELNTIV